MEDIKMGQLWGEGNKNSMFSFLFLQISTCCGEKASFKRLPPGTSHLSPVTLKQVNTVPSFQSSYVCTDVYTNTCKGFQGT